MISRLSGLDALRAALTLLVVFHHAAITYGAVGGWFYIENHDHGAPQTIVMTFFCGINQAYFMGLFFLLAGYFTPAAIDRKGYRRFLLDRLVRLGIPLLLFGLVLGPLTVALDAHQNPWVVAQWLWEHGRFIRGPLWFAEALLIFSVAAMLWHRLGGWAPSRFPGNRALAVAVLITGAAAFGLRLIWPVGQELIGLQIGFFASYIALFALGLTAGRGGWLMPPPPQQVRVWWIVACCALPILPVTYIVAPHISWLAGNVVGGWSLPAMIYAFWEPFLALGVCLMLLAASTRWSTATPLWRNLARRAFAIYVIHPPIVVGVALAWASVAAPPMLKFLVTGSVSCLLCFVAAGLLLRLPLVGRVL